MLLLCFSLGDERFALAAKAIREITPTVGMKKIPKAPDWVAGIMNYHADIVPVVDLCALNMQKPAKKQMSTRIILINFIDHQGVERLLGLLAEKVTEILRRKPEEFSNSGIVVPDAPWLGDVANSSNGMIQLITVEKLLPANVQGLLFQEARGKEQ